MKNTHYKAQARIQELECSLKESYEAMLVMRALLAKADISIVGGKLNAVIESASFTLYPPSSKVVDVMVNSTHLPVA